MSIEEENKLRDALKQKQTVVWAPDDETCRQVVVIDTHAEEDDDEIQCAIFKDGKYVALYNCSITEFAILQYMS